MKIFDSAAMYKQWGNLVSPVSRMRLCSRPGWRKASSLQERICVPTSSELVARIRALSSFRFTPAMEATSLMSSSSLKCERWQINKILWDKQVWLVDKNEHCTFFVRQLFVLLKSSQTLKMYINLSQTKRKSYYVVIYCQSLQQKPTKQFRERNLSSVQHITMQRKPVDQRVTGTQGCHSAMMHWAFQISAQRVFVWYSSRVT